MLRVSARDQGSCLALGCRGPGVAGIDHSGNAGTISVSATADGRIIVADQGKGIPPEQQALVFEPSYRVLPRSRGAGHGLSLVRQIVTGHHGRVTVESGLTGTVFTIYL